MEDKKVLNEKGLEKVNGGAKTTGETDAEKISIEGLEAVGPYGAEIPGGIMYN